MELGVAIIQVVILVYVQPINISYLVNLIWNEQEILSGNDLRGRLIVGW